MTPAELIAANLHALPHPDGTPRQLAGYSTQLLPEALQTQVAQSARDVAEAIVYLLTTNNLHIVTEQQIAPPANNEPPQIANVHCANCDTRILQLNLVNPEHSLTNAQYLIRAISGLNPDCPHV